MECCMWILQSFYKGKKDRQKRRGQANISNEKSTQKNTVMVSLCTQEEASVIYFHALLWGIHSFPKPCEKKKRSHRHHDSGFQKPAATTATPARCNLPRGCPHCHFQKQWVCVHVHTRTHIYLCMGACHFYSSLGWTALGNHSPTSTVYNERGLATHLVAVPASWHRKLPGLACGLCCPFLSLPVLARRHLDWCKTQARSFQSPALCGFSDWIRNLAS